MEVVKCLGQMSTKYWKTFSLCYNVPFKDTNCILGFTQSNFARNMIITIRLKYIYLKYSRHGLGLINNFCLRRNYNHFQSDSAIFLLILSNSLKRRTSAYWERCSEERSPMIHHITRLIDVTVNRIPEVQHYRHTKIVMHVIRD